MPRDPDAAARLVDNGVSWGRRPIPAVPGVNGFQYDPVVKVANNGVVYATWMNRYDIVFSKSSNHGAAWSAPIEVSGQPGATSRGSA